MANAIIYGKSGSGKTVQLARISAPKKKKNLLLCSDNSSIVLDLFPEIKKNVDIQIVNKWLNKDESGREQECYLTQFEKAVESGKYDVIITDNLSDLFNMAILELDESRYGSKDRRQNYSVIYDAIKRLIRKAGQLDCHTAFSCWESQEEVILSDGSVGQRLQPKIPKKILDDVVGLCNIVGRVAYAEKDGKGDYFFDFRSSDRVYGKNQYSGKKNCMPEDLFKKQEV